jgi:multidrug resistance efflux pump
LAIIKSSNCQIIKLKKTMKFNLLYLIWLLALGGFLYIAQHLKTQSGQQLFGIAEAEGKNIKVDFPAVVQQCRIRAGQQVRKGDTVLVLFRGELDQKTTLKSSELQQIETERDVKSNIVAKEMELFVARQNARIADLQAQIRVIESEINAQNNLKDFIGSGKTVDNNIKLQEIKTLEEAIRQANLQTIEQRKVFDNQQVGNNSVSAAKAKQLNEELAFIGKEKIKLILVAPCDGFIEQVFVANGEVCDAYKDLYKINPFQPTKIIGFIHESLNMNYRLGDTVTLQSFTRPDVRSKAILTSISPKLVELPYRLRRNAEIKSWGREVYVNLPLENQFFIGEKIQLRLQQ